MSDQIPIMKRKRGRPPKPARVCQILEYKVEGKMRLLIVYTDGRVGVWPESPEDPDKPVEFRLTPIRFVLP